jgi:hypothetical protein
LSALAQSVSKAEAQMKAILPEVTDDTSVFATRFVLSAPYLMPAASVWYDRPLLKGGDINALKGRGVLTPNDHVFDYANGSVYNLMPELQQHRRTYLLWRAPPVEEAVLLDGTRSPIPPETVFYETLVVDEQRGRLTTQVFPSPGEWLSLGYRIQVPQDASLEYATMGNPGQQFRVRLMREDGSMETLDQFVVPSGDQNAWREVAVPLTRHEGELVTIYFEASGAGGDLEDAPAYWGNPRLVVD